MALLWARVSPLLLPSQPLVGPGRAAQSPQVASTRRHRIHPLAEPVRAAAVGGLALCVFRTPSRIDERASILGCRPGQRRNLPAGRSAAAPRNLATCDDPHTAPASSVHDDFRGQPPPSHTPLTGTSSRHRPHPLRPGKTTTGAGPGVSAGFGARDQGCLGNDEGPRPVAGALHCGAAGNRTRVLRHFTKASPCAVRYVSTWTSGSREQVRMTVPVAVWRPAPPRDRVDR